MTGSTNPSPCFHTTSNLLLAVVEKDTIDEVMIDLPRLTRKKIFITGARPMTTCFRVHPYSRRRCTWCSPRILCLKIRADHDVAGIPVYHATVGPTMGRNRRAEDDAIPMMGQL